MNQSYSFLKMATFAILFFILTLISCHQSAINQDANQAYHQYQLTTSGAGEAMDAWSFERSFPNGKIEQRKVVEAHEAIQKESDISRKTPDEWLSLGPENVGGRTLCLAFHPTDSNVIYAGSASGGLWKTNSMGEGRFAWSHVPTGFPVLGVGAILIDPNNPDIMYIGTGETYHNFGVAEPGIINRFTRGSYGIGILKTMDGGETWNQVLAFDSEDLVGVADMELNLLNTNEMYAATTIGLFQSTDAGSSWQNILPISQIIDLELDPTNGDILYVSQGNLNTGLDPSLVGLFKSTDKGQNFVELLDDGLLGAWSGNAKLSILASNPNTIWASIQVGWFNNGPTTPGGLYRSDDAGVNWMRLDSTNVATWQGWYSHDIAINPTNSNQVIYVGLDVWRSEDGGLSLTKQSDWTQWTFGKLDVDVSEGPVDYVHGDIHAVYYHLHNPRKVFYATDGGVFVSNDEGRTFETRNGSLQTTQFYANFATSTTDPDLAIGGAQDNAIPIFLMGAHPGHETLEEMECQPPSTRSMIASFTPQHKVYFWVVRMIGGRLLI